jgi:hypothetical protein
MHEHHGADKLTQAEQHHKYHHHHENEDVDVDVNGDDKTKHEHHHNHGEHVTTSGRSQKDSKWSGRGGCDKKCVFTVEEDTRQNVKHLMESLIQMLKSGGLKMQSVNGTTNLVIAIATRGGHVHISGPMGNVTANADGKSIVKVVKWDMENNTLTTTTVVPSKNVEETMTEQKWDTTRSITSDSQDVSNSVSSEELWRMTSSTVIPVLTTTVTSETIVNVDTAIINVDTVSDVVVVTPTTSTVTTTITEDESVTSVHVTEESTTTNVIMLNSVNKK